MPYRLQAIGPDDPEFAEASALRYRTLHEPLGLPASRDWNDADPNTRHLIALRGGEVVGYARLNLAPPTAQIRHVTVAPSERGVGLGRTLVHDLLVRAAREGCASAWLNARFTALGFWRSIGFVESDQPLTAAEDSHLPHRRMTISLRR